MVNCKKTQTHDTVYLCIKNLKNLNEENFSLAAVDFELVLQPSEVKRRNPIFINCL